MIERATGLSRASLAQAVGLAALETRGDLDRLAAVLASGLEVWA